ncbi:hypothetical protein ES703_114103 [subsurface metagenome]
MEKGISKYWTPGKEAWGRQLIDSSPNFAAQHLMISIRDMLKYDGRTRAGRRAFARARLRLATATDQDLEDMAKIYVTLFKEKSERTEAEELERLKDQRDRLREQGFKRSELEH